MNPPHPHRHAARTGSRGIVRRVTLAVTLHPDTVRQVRHVAEAERISLSRAAERMLLCYRPDAMARMPAVVADDQHLPPGA